MAIEHYEITKRQFQIIIPIFDQSLPLTFTTKKRKTIRISATTYFLFVVQVLTVFNTPAIESDRVENAATCKIQLNDSFDDFKIDKFHIMHSVIYLHALFYIRRLQKLFVSDVFI